MSRHPTEDESYRQGVAVTLRVVSEWLNARPDPKPTFRFPPVPLIAELREVSLATNEAARELATLVCRRVRERTGREVTVLQFETVIRNFGLPFETCSLADLGLKVGRA